MSDKTLGNARGLNSIADPSQFKGSSGRAKFARPPRQESPPPPKPSQTEPSAAASPVASSPAPQPVVTPHRAVTPGIRRKRRELSVPHRVAEALEATGINPADVVMSGYRNHSDAIYSGAGGRMMAKGRTRLRLSISDTEFEQITRLGLARGWNRSETVSVILALELFPAAVTSSGAAAAND